MSEEEKKPATKTDLARFDDLVKAQNDGADVKILHPVTGEEIGLTINVSGPDSAKVQKATRLYRDELIQMRRTNPSSTDTTLADIKLTARVCNSWKFAADTTIDGKVPEFSLEQAIAVMKRFPFIREQVDAAAGTRAGFSKT